MRTILTRKGNKHKLAPAIIAQFPKTYDLYAEPFFGAGAVYFHLPEPPKTVLLNDLDGDVWNLFTVLKSPAQRARLEAALASVLFHRQQLEQFKAARPADPVQRAVRFLYLSNLTLYGSGNTLKYEPNQALKLARERIRPCAEQLQKALFTNDDFRDFFKRTRHGMARAASPLIYCDPPYLGTTSYDYKDSGIWTKKDLAELLDLLKATGAKFLVSEFDSPDVLAEAKKRKLKIIMLGERQNLKNRRTEILLKNY
jgi:DNA adenine methylase